MKKPSPAILIGLGGATASLIEKYLQQGRLPNLAALIKKGAFTRMRPVFPGTPPVGWASVSTGAYPGTHSIPGAVIPDKVGGLEGGMDGYSPSACQAQTLWQAAAFRKLKVATFNFPGSHPSRDENHVSIAGRGLPADQVEYALRQSSCFATPTYQSQVRDFTPLQLSGNRAVMQLAPTAQTGSGLGLTCEWIANPGQKPLVRITDPKGVEVAILNHHQPSGWLWGECIVGRQSKRAYYQLELTHISNREPAFAIYVSPVICAQDLGSHPELLADLVKELGVLPAYNGSRAVRRGWCSPQRMLEEGLQQGVWLAQAARRLVGAQKYHLALLHWTLLNDVQHAYWGGLDVLSPWHDARFGRIFAGLVEQAYQAADALIGELLPMLDEGVTLAVVGDCGHLPHLNSVSINHCLEEKGWLQFNQDGSGISQVDWSKTQAFALPGQGQVWINRKNAAKGKAYETLRQQVMDALLDLRDPISGICPVAKVIRAEEARELGLWSDRTGDVVFLMLPGYSNDQDWHLSIDAHGDVMVSMDKSAGASQVAGSSLAAQSVQGGCDPAAVLGEGSAETIFALAGEGVRSSVLEVVPDLTTVAPTLCRITGLPLPQDCEGQPLAGWLD